MTQQAIYRLIGLLALLLTLSGAACIADEPPSPEPPPGFVSILDISDPADVHAVPAVVAVGWTSSSYMRRLFVQTPAGENAILTLRRRPAEGLIEIRLDLVTSEWSARMTAQSAQTFSKVQDIADPGIIQEFAPENLTWQLSSSGPLHTARETVQFLSSLGRDCEACPALALDEELVLIDRLTADMDAVEFHGTDPYQGFVWIVEAGAASRQGEGLPPATAERLARFGESFRGDPLANL